MTSFIAMRLDRNFEFGARFDLDGTERSIPPLARKIINVTKPTGRRSCTVQFFGDQEIAQQELVILRFGSHDDEAKRSPCSRTSPSIELPLFGTEEDKIEIKPNSVFWHRWFKFMKDYSASYMIIFDILKAALRR